MWVMEIFKTINAECYDVEKYQLKWLSVLSWIDRTWTWVKVFDRTWTWV